MKKINDAAVWVKESYIQLLREGKTPALLSAIVDRSRKDILARVDRRYNQSGALARIEVKARSLIRLACKNDPTLEATLRQMRNSHNEILPI